MAKGFSGGPDFSGLLVLVCIIGVIGYTIYAYEGPFWQKLLIAPGMLLTLVVGGIVASLLFGGLFWVFLAGARQRRKARLRRLLALERETDTALAVAEAQSACESFDFSDSDVFRRTPELCLEFAAAARRDGPLRPYYLRALMDNAPWNAEVESALFEGRAAVAAPDLWRWLYWFRKTPPDGDPAASDRLAAALEHCLAEGNEHRRRGYWADCLERVRDSEPWRRLAQRCRVDLVALEAERGARLNAREREGLELLLRAGAG